MAESQSHALELSWLRGLVLSARLLARDWRAGEMRVLAVGLLIAVASLTTVVLGKQRAERNPQVVAPTPQAEEK